MRESQGKINCSSQVSQMQKFTWKPVTGHLIQRYLIQIARAMLTLLHYSWNFKYITVNSFLIPGTELCPKTLLVNETGVV